MRYVWDRLKIDNIFVVRPEIKRPLANIIFRWVNNIKMGFRPKECAGVDLNETAQRKG